jgi:galactokinase
MNQLHEQTVSIFRDHFTTAPDHVVMAPGRVNLIGEHTDYNQGFVLPMAIDRHTWIALRPRDDRTVRLYSANHQTWITFDLDHLEKEQGWGEYVKGVSRALLDDDFTLRGWEGVTTCDVPLGAGLSSSASFELAVARAFATVSQFPWDAKQMAIIGQRAENQWVGVNCGIMDQMISAVGRAGFAVLIDCRDYHFDYMPVPENTVVVIMDTATRRGLVESAYNERRQQCEEASAFFGVTYLRDVTLDQLESSKDRLDPKTFARARHVITENERTLRAAEAMKAGQARELGLLMNASHDSLRDDFEVTNRELNLIVDHARKAPGCLGARMTGAGFGGCAVAIVEREEADAFMAYTTSRYKHDAGLEPAMYSCHPEEGASEVS